MEHSHVGQYSKKLEAKRMKKKEETRKRKPPRKRVTDVGSVLHCGIRIQTLILTSEKNIITDLRRRLSSVNLKKIAFDPRKSSAYLLIN